MKDQLERVIWQMYEAGMRCSEAIREFQKGFILTVLRDQRGNQCKAAKKLGVHRIRCAVAIRLLEIDIGPTRATESRRPPRSEGPLSLRRRVT